MLNSYNQKLYEQGLKRAAIFSKLKEKGFTLEEIAKKYKISKQRVSVILAKLK